MICKPSYTEMSLHHKSRSLINLPRASTVNTRHFTYAGNKKLLKNCSTTSLMSIYDDDIVDSLSSTDESSECSCSVEPLNTSIIVEEDEEETEYDHLRTYPWFVGKLSRIGAEKYLEGVKNGTFLVRESDGQQGYTHAIAIRWKNQPSHIRIYKRDDTYSVSSYHSDSFHTIDELVAYFQVNSLGDTFPFVRTTLRFPYRSTLAGSSGSESNDYAEDLPGSPELEPPELPPRSPTMSIVNPNKPLQDQQWYHGRITRTEAEFLLASKPEFSFLLRDSESSVTGYSLSLNESTSGFVHLRIIREGEGYVLGQFSQLFNTVPECIYYYCHHKLNIKGAAHGCLRYPVHR